MVNMVNEEVIMTQEGYDKIDAELKELVSVKRPEISDRIREALSYGDISENAEYDAAKNEQAENEDRIRDLENMLRKAKIVQEEDVKGDVVGIGLDVKVKNTDTKEETTFSIVGATESDPFNGKITTDSAVGKALVGCKAGDTVQVEIPDGVVNYKIMKIIK